MRITMIALFVLNIRSSTHLRLTLKNWEDLFGESDNDNDDEFDGFFLFFYLPYLSSIHEKAMYRYVLDGKSSLAWELPFPGHLSST